MSDHDDVPTYIRRSDEEIERTLSQFDSEPGIKAKSKIELRTEYRSISIIDDRQSVHLVCMEDINSKPTRWLWRGWLARGKLHILAGAPGSGKTTIAISLAAAITNGGKLPDGTQAPIGNVLIWSGEDDASDTLKPRMVAAGADVSRVFFVGGVGIGEESRPFDPSRDLPALTYAAEAIGNISLLIADPVVSAVTGDSHKNTEVRRALDPIVKLAERLDCAVIGITHFSKGTAGRDPLERVTGSIAFGAVARVVLVTAKGENGERLLARAKSNIGKDDGGFAYTLDIVDADGIEASRVQWGLALEGSARELLGDAETEKGSERSATDEAQEWLEEMLEKGSMQAVEVQKQARQAGISEKALRSGRERLGIKPKKSSYGGGWEWGLPAQDAQGARSFPTKNVGIFDSARAPSQHTSQAAADYLNASDGK